MALAVCVGEADGLGSASCDGCGDARCTTGEADSATEGAVSAGAGDDCSAATFPEGTAGAGMEVDGPEFWGVATAHPTRRMAQHAVASHGDADAMSPLNPNR
jgi:hypothetical protein